MLISELKTAVFLWVRRQTVQTNNYIKDNEVIENIKTTEKIVSKSGQMNHKHEQSDCWIWESIWKSFSRFWIKSWKQRPTTHSKNYTKEKVCNLLRESRES